MAGRGGLGVEIPIELKKRCLDAKEKGMTAREVYTSIFLPEHDTMSLETFKRKINRWARQQFASESTLHAGTFPNFIPHGATVQVNGKGEVTQAWIKQTGDGGEYERLLDAIRANTPPAEIERVVCDGIEMLEIPLLDMHFPLSDHAALCAEVLDLIDQKYWSKIVMVIGQDLFHNDDFRGRTSSGRQIEIVDMVQAWHFAKSFYYAICESALRKAQSVQLIYSVGNHDESMAWAFVQLLKEHFPQIKVDDSMKPRKVIAWEKCFIGVTHGANKASTNQDLRGQFTIEFPAEFAKATVREVHAGHLHHERTGDVYGVIVRRLASGVPTDAWHSNEGYVGQHKRFMAFEWLPTRLKAIHYLGG